MTYTTEIVRGEIVKLLEGDQAHLTLDAAVAELPDEAWGKKAEHQAHSVYELLWHVWRAQRDMLEYCTREDYEAPQWPDAYWPSQSGPGGDAIPPEQLLDDFQSDLSELQRLAREVDLSAKVPTHDSHTLLRSLMIAADHNAYHTAQIVDLRRALGAWDRD